MQSNMSEITFKHLLMYLQDILGFSQNFYEHIIKLEKFFSEIDFIWSWTDS